MSAHPAEVNEKIHCAGIVFNSTVAYLFEVMIHDDEPPDLQAMRVAAASAKAAIEPWYVLGEEPGAGGTARYVDSSVERMQVHVKGLLPERQTVTCNGRRLPLQPTGTNGEFVAGVRYRAWQPPRCLHPTIGVHTPLLFDLLDIDNRRSLGGCTYHVGHPGGHNYETFPVNSNEVESRRRATFFPIGHTTGEMAVPPAETQPEFPGTLDLRTTP